MSLMTRRARQLRANMTDAERCLWRGLRYDQLGVRFRRQYVMGQRYILDFFAPKIKLAVEVDGGQHVDREGADQARGEWLGQRGVLVVRYWNTDVLLATVDVLADIHRHVTVRLGGEPSPPAPLLAGGGRRA